MAFVTTTIVGSQGSALWVTLTFNDVNGHGQSATVVNSTGLSIEFTISDGTTTIVRTAGQGTTTISLPANVVVMVDGATLAFNFSYTYV